MYKKLVNFDGSSQNMVLRVNDNVYIPFDEANTDYQAYLKWLEEGNTPLPAEGTE